MPRTYAKTFDFAKGFAIIEKGFFYAKNIEHDTESVF